MLDVRFEVLIDIVQFESFITLAAFIVSQFGLLIWFSFVHVSSFTFSLACVFVVSDFQSFEMLYCCSLVCKDIIA